MAGGGDPGDQAAPVVTDEVERRPLHGVGDTHDVVDQVGEAVGLDAVGTGEGGVAPLVERDGAVAGTCELVEHEPPRP